MKHSSCEDGLHPVALPVRSEFPCTPSHLFELSGSTGSVASPVFVDFCCGGGGEDSVFFRCGILFLFGTHTKPYTLTRHVTRAERKALLSLKLHSPVLFRETGGCEHKREREREREREKRREEKRDETRREKKTAEEFHTPDSCRKADVTTQSVCAGVPQVMRMSSWICMNIRFQLFVFFWIPSPAPKASRSRATLLRSFY